MPDSQRFLDAIKKIEAHEFDLIGLISTTENLFSSGDKEFALLLYKYWLLTNPTHPSRYVAAFNCGVHLLNSGEAQKAIEFFSQAVSSNPDFFTGRSSLAAAYEQAGNIDSAMSEWQQILERLPTVTAANISIKAYAYKNIARVGKGETVNESLKKAVEIDPGQRDALHHWVKNRQAGCVWPVLETVGKFSGKGILQRMAPLPMAMFTDDPLLQLATAYEYTRCLVNKETDMSVIGEWPVPDSPNRDRLRIGYLSSDFCQHAVGYLMMDIFQHHNRDRYEITVFNIGERNNDPIQTKIMGKVDRWEDLRNIDDKHAAEIILDHGIDILLDMNGHTNFQRTRLLALKPAPIIANWLGYPGTMGSYVHNYIIADDFIIPPELERYYSEKLLRLPCYQANNSIYTVPLVKQSRRDLGLPETGVVFCCFNGSVKITETVFARWMEILAAVPESVLWLRGNPEDDVATRLRAGAQQRGIAPERLVFLPFRSNTEYLGCHRYADLFLDTFPYGAHTTASDALRMGVPIVTMPGRSFASRVCGSLSRAAGLPEMVCDSPEQYVQLAIALGKDPARLKEIKQRLESGLPNCVLFNPKLLTTELEKLFEYMWTEYCSGRIHRPHFHDMPFITAFSPVD